MKGFSAAAKTLVCYTAVFITWDQALFSFRFENYIPCMRMYENR